MLYMIIHVDESLSQGTNIQLKGSHLVHSQRKNFPFISIKAINGSLTRTWLCLSLADIIYELTTRGLVVS